MINKCPHCGVKLNEETLGQEQTGTTYYKMYLDNGDLEYDIIDESYDDSKFYCRECNGELDIDNEEVISLLKK